MREAIRRLHKALATWTSEQTLERFLTDLALRGNVAASTQNQASSAIAVFCNDVLSAPLHDVDVLQSTRPVHLRHAPIIAETRALLQAVRDEPGYPTDLNLGADLLFILGAKGGKDRVVSLPRSLALELRFRWDSPARSGARTITTEVRSRFRINWRESSRNINSPSLGPDCFPPDILIGIRAPGMWCATACTKPMSSAANSGSWSCHTSCAATTPLTASPRRTLRRVAMGPADGARCSAGTPVPAGLDVLFLNCRGRFGPPDPPRMIPRRLGSAPRCFG